jgi:excisionase family DNA binding protein
MNLDDDPVLTRTEAAKVLRCHPHTIDKLITAGRLDARKMGASTLIPSASIREFIDNLPAKKVGHFSKSEAIKFAMGIGVINCPRLARRSGSNRSEALRWANCAVTGCLL